MDLTPVLDWLYAIKQWLIDLVVGIVADLINLFFDAFIWIVSQIYYLIILVVAMIPAPDLMGGVTMTSIMDAMPSIVIFLFVQLEFAKGIGMITSAYLFYFLRRLITLGHW